MSQTELESLRLIENVVRQGRVAHIGEERIELEAGSIPTDPEQIYVDCTAEGIRRVPVRPIFEPNRITVQRSGPCNQHSTPPSQRLWSLPATTTTRRTGSAHHTSIQLPLDWLSVTFFGQRTQALWLEQPDLVSWLERSRLNATRGLIERAADPKMQPTIARLFTSREPAIDNLEKLLAQAA